MNLPPQTLSGDGQQLDSPVLEQRCGRLERGGIDDRQEIINANSRADRLVEPADSLGGDLQIEEKPAGAVVLRERPHCKNGSQNPKHALGVPAHQLVDDLLECVNLSCRR